MAKNLGGENIPLAELPRHSTRRIIEGLLALLRVVSRTFLFCVYIFMIYECYHKIDS